MENEKKALKFPVGAIFMLLYVLLEVVQLIQIFSHPYLIISFGLISRLISSIALCAIAVLAIMKKRGVAILVPAGLISLLTLISFNVSSLLYLISIACIILFSLDDMNIGDLSKFRKIAKNVFIISVISGAVLAVVLDIINVWANPDSEFINGWIVIINYILYPLSMLLIGLWIDDPFKSEKKNTDSTVTSDYYVSLGKHICLLIFTFGIWQMIWIYKQTKFTNNAKGEEERNPTTKLLLYLFIPFYSIYWTYKTAQRIDIIAKDNGCNSELSTICLILAIFIGIVPPILMQDKVNEIIKKLSTKSEDV